MKQLTIIITLIIVQFFTITTSAQENYIADNNFNRDNAPVKLDDPLGEKYTTGGDVNTLIGTVISAILGIVGSLALAMFIYGGFVWMTAAGNKTNVEKGKDIITWAALGLVVIFSAYALVNFILKNVIGGMAG